MVASAAAVHLPRSPFGCLDVPAVAEQRGDVLVRDVVGRVEPVGLGLLGVDVGVVHDQQRPAWSHGVEQRAPGSVVGLTSYKRGV